MGWHQDFAKTWNVEVIFQISGFHQSPRLIESQQLLPISQPLTKSWKCFFSGNMCKHAHGEICTVNAHLMGGLIFPMKMALNMLILLTSTCDVHIKTSMKLHVINPPSAWCFYHCCFFCGKHIISSITFFSSSKGNCLYFHCLLSSIFPYELTSTIKNEQKTPKFLKTQTLGSEIRSWLFEEFSYIMS